jgi:hypothetical protein
MKNRPKLVFQERWKMRSEKKDSDRALIASRSAGPVFEGKENSAWRRRSCSGSELFIILNVGFSVIAGTRSFTALSTVICYGLYY